MTGTLCQTPVINYLMSDNGNKLPYVTNGNLESKISYVKTAVRRLKIVSTAVLLLHTKTYSFSSFWGFNS